MTADNDDGTPQPASGPMTKEVDAAGVQVRRIDTTILGTPAAPVTVHLHDGMVTGDLAEVNLARVVGVWHRRPSEFAATHEVDSLTEGLNAGIRLIQRRAHGYANLNNLIDMIYLCHGGIPTPLPTETH